MNKALPADLLLDKMKGSGYDIRSRKCRVLDFGQPDKRKQILKFFIRCQPKSGSMRTHMAYIKYLKGNIPLGRQALEMHCTCESWQFQGTAYIATRQKFALFSREQRYPHIRDPHLQHFLCKHLIHILSHTHRRTPNALIEARTKMSRTTSPRHITPDTKLTTPTKPINQKKRPKMKRKK